MRNCLRAHYIVLLQLGDERVKRESQSWSDEQHPHAETPEGNMTLLQIHLEVQLNH